jgi:hypothetical protein
MSITSRRFARYIALPAVSAGIIGGAALGLAGAANAATTTLNDQRSSFVATPAVKAQPAPEAQPGWRWHHGMHHLADLQPSAIR